MNTNLFAPKAFGALECGGPPKGGFAVASLAPLSESRLLAAKFCGFADNLCTLRNDCVGCRASNVTSGQFSISTKQGAVH
jgi:hypothetical protein